jgi:HAD superfamily hydrolase (TIGR01509 family)
MASGIETLGDYDVYLFDWDGLIVNTQELLWRAWGEAFSKECSAREAPLTFSEWSLHCHSRFYRTRPHPETYLDWQTRQRIEEQRHRLYRQLLHHDVTLLEGVEDFLKSLDPNHVFIVTSSSRAEVMLIRNQLKCAVLEAIPMSHWFTRDVYKHPKPDPDGWNLAIAMAYQEQRRTEELRIIGFEDTPSGLRSLLAARPMLRTCVLLTSILYEDEWNNDPRVMRLQHF